MLKLEVYIANSWEGKMDVKWGESKNKLESMKRSQDHENELGPVSVFTVSILY